VLAEIHRDYVEAGADVVTANTFRTYARTLEAADMPERDRELTVLAVKIARSAAGETALVAGSQPPLEDCYEPARVPDDAALAREHARMAENLAEAGVDFVLAETHNTIREALAATRAARAAGLTVVTSFVCGRDGRLLSGESLADAARAVLLLESAALAVNCVPADVVEACLCELAKTAPGVPLGGYANIGYADPEYGWVNTDAQDPLAYAEYASRWLDAGASIIGGCCGTTPAHTRALRELIDPRRDESA
jgi:S-methylmethionine-dependent homocysteine/selenocysteine methylase